MDTSKNQDFAVPRSQRNGNGTYHWYTWGGITYLEWQRDEARVPQQVTG